MTGRKCHSCGAMAVVGRSSCDPCLAADRRSKNEWWAAAPDGVCRSCRKQPRAPGKQRCEFCCERKRQSDKARGRHPDRHYLDRYGMTRAQIAELRENQGGVCAACGETPDRGRFDIDHDHDTGAVRGLLCHGCNAALGFMRENPERIRRLSGYAEMCAALKRRAG